MERRHDARSPSCSPARARSSSGMGRDIAEAEPEAMAVFEEGSEASGLDLKRLCFCGYGRGADADRPAAAGARRDEPRDQRGAPRSRHRARLRRRPLGRRVLGARRGHSLGVAETIAPRARARARHGRRRQGAARLDGGDPRPRRRGGRGALPQDRERLAGELQLPGPARDLGRDRRGRRVLRRRRSTKARGAPCACASRARSTRRSSSSPPSGCGPRSTGSTSRCRPPSSCRP